MSLLDQLLTSALSTVTTNKTTAQTLLDEYWLAYPEAETAAVVRWLCNQVTYTCIAPSDSTEDQTATRPAEDALWVDCVVMSK